MQIYLSILLLLWFDDLQILFQLYLKLNKN